MIDGKTVSVIITTYERFATIPDICRAWLNEDVEEVWYVVIEKED